MNELSLKQATFVRHYASGDSAAMAARKAGYASSQSDRASQHVLSNPKVRAAVEAARLEIQAATQYDATRAMADLTRVVEFARETRNATAMARATELMMKLNGLLVDRIQLEPLDLAGALIDARRRSPVTIDVTSSDESSTQ